MNKRLDVPLVPNPDATHCYQACLKTMLEYPDNEQAYGWEELDSISGKAEGLWTWPMASWLWAQRHSSEVSVINTFDYPRFAEEGMEYLTEYFGAEVAKRLIEMSDIAQERRFAAELVEEVEVECRVPTIEDIHRAIGRGILVCCNVNSRKLNGRPGFAGHFVVATGYEDAALFLNDPGGALTPPQKDRRVYNNAFEAAWGDPRPEVKNLFTISRYTPTMAT